MIPLKKFADYEVQLLSLVNDSKFRPFLWQLMVFLQIIKYYLTFFNHAKPQWISKLWRKGTQELLHLVKELVHLLWLLWYRNMITVIAIICFIKAIDHVFCWSIDLVELDIIIDKFMKMGYYRISRTVFYKIRARDVVIWNTMIGGYVRKAWYEEALRLFWAMIRSNIEPDKFTLAWL